MASVYSFWAAFAALWKIKRGKKHCANGCKWLKWYIFGLWWCLLTFNPHSKTTPHLKANQKNLYNTDGPHLAVCWWAKTPLDIKLQCWLLHLKFHFVTFNHNEQMSSLIITLCFSVTPFNKGSESTLANINKVRFTTTPRGICIAGWKEAQNHGMTLLIHKGNYAWGETSIIAPVVSVLLPPSFSHAFSATDGISGPQKWMRDN